MKSSIQKGLILFLSNDESPMNYPSNPYHYRQDSTFLYYIGLDEPNVYAIIDLDEDKEIVFGDELSIDDIIWMGPQPKLIEKSKQYGIENVLPLTELENYLSKSIKKGQTIHYLPPYRAEHTIKLSSWLQIDPKKVKDNASLEFIKTVINQRSIKSEEEINEIENAHSTTYDMHTTAMKMAKPGTIERVISGTIEGIALAKGAPVSFPVILSINGEILHNHSHDNQMHDGDLLINDSGAESMYHYAADITRTIPVSGKFSEKQKTVYNIVLKSQMDAIKAIKPGIKYIDIHKQTASVIANGLKEIGLMKGDMAEAVEQGAHALFFPHGLGHMMGLDVHDMENLGEDLVGYDDTIKRSDQFGLAYLRLAKELKEGYVLTVEPGIYFIPQLIDLWKSENKFSSFIDYDNVEKYKDFGGIRIEDDVLVTANGQRVIGRTIPKTIDDVENMCNR
jgi:Xaa-Pro aminopeptidase